MTTDSTDEANADEAKAEQGPPLVLEAVFRTHARFVANTLRRFGVPPADLPDQLQEVFLIVQSLKDDYDSSRPIRPWLFGIAYRVAARYRAGRRRQLAAEPIEEDTATDTEPLADATLESQENQALVLAGLESIDLSRRAVFVMADIEGESVPEIAHALQIPLNTAYSRLRLAREDFARAVRRIRLARGDSA
jgi:RNA polymerase sigma-70 factor (ECF subfamily)